MKREYKKKTKRQKLDIKLKKVWSLIVRHQCYCDLCGRGGELKNFDAHHIKGRATEETRYDLDNGACLCGGECHRFGVHLDTLKAAILIDKLKKRRGQKWYDELVRKSKITTKYKVEELEEILEKLSTHLNI